jgi:hypothetical protein
MAHLIEFYAPSSFRPTIKWPPKEKRGKVIAFMSPRKESAAIVCGAYEELDSESSQSSQSWVDEGTPLSNACRIIFQTSGSWMAAENFTSGNRKYRPATDLSESCVRSLRTGVGRKLTVRCHIYRQLTRNRGVIHRVMFINAAIHQKLSTGEEPAPR